VNGRTFSFFLIIKNNVYEIVQLEINFNAGYINNALNVTHIFSEIRAEVNNTKQAWNLESKFLALHNNDKRDSAETARINVINNYISTA
jgi:hypothetical protein